MSSSPSTAKKPKPNKQKQQQLEWCFPIPEQRKYRKVLELGESQVNQTAEAITETSTQEPQTILSFCCLFNTKTYKNGLC
jgi:hypothetical protein